MNGFSGIFTDALNIILTLDNEFYGIILLSLQVSFTAILLSCIFAIPLAAILSIKQFRFKSIIMILINSLMALPPVTVGLILYLLLSSRGILGYLDLLYSPTAMIIAQFIIVSPIILGLSKKTIDNLFLIFKEYFISIDAPTFKVAKTLIWESRHELTVNGIAGLGRALSEVGAIIIVGGNIAHVTRVMTSSIVLETSRGDLSLALALGISLIMIAILINIIIYMFYNKA